MKCTDNLNPGYGHVLFALQIKMLKNTVNKSVRKACGSEFNLNMQDRRKHDWHILQVNIKYIQIAGPNAKSWCHNQDRNSYCHSAIFNCWLHDFLNVPQVTWTFSKRALISGIPVAAKKGKRLFQSGMTWYTDYKENYSIDIGTVPCEKVAWSSMNRLLASNITLPAVRKPYNLNFHASTSFWDGFNGLVYANRVDEKQIYIRSVFTDDKQMCFFLCSLRSAGFIVVCCSSLLLQNPPNKLPQFILSLSLYDLRFNCGLVKKSLEVGLEVFYASLVVWITGMTDWFETFWSYQMHLWFLLILEV